MTTIDQLNAVKRAIERSNEAVHISLNSNEQIGTESIKYSNKLLNDYNELINKYNDEKVGKPLFKNR